MTVWEPTQDFPTREPTLVDDNVQNILIMNNDGNRIVKKSTDKHAMKLLL